MDSDDILKEMTNIPMVKFEQDGLVLAGYDGEAGNPKLIGYDYEYKFVNDELTASEPNGIYSDSSYGGYIMSETELEFLDKIRFEFSSVGDDLIFELNLLEEYKGIETIAMKYTVRFELTDSEFYQFDEYTPIEEILNR